MVAFGQLCSELLGFVVVCRCNSVCKSQRQNVDDDDGDGNGVYDDTIEHEDNDDGDYDDGNE